MRALAMTLANTLDGIRRAGIAPALLLPSSAAVYGNPARLPVPETGAVAPISPYGFHKAACELLGREAGEILGLRVMICRLFSVYGPRQRRLLLWEAYQQLASDAPVVELQGTGSETRDFLHMDDVSMALLALAQHAKRGATVVNIGSGIEISVSQVVEEMKRLMDRDKMLMCHGSARPGDPRHWEADITRLRSLMPGWKPRSLEEGMTETIENWNRRG
jgi:nucleoside-diphosphate-sugar epimerase